MVEASPLFAATFQQHQDVVDLLLAHPGIQVPRHSQLSYARASGEQDSMDSAEQGAVDELMGI